MTAPEKKKPKDYLDQLANARITPEQQKKAMIGGQVGGSVGALTGTALGSAVGAGSALVSRGRANRALKQTLAAGGKGKKERARLNALKKPGDSAATGAFLGAGTGTALGGGGGAVGGLYAGRPRKDDPNHRHHPENPRNKRVKKRSPLQDRPREQRTDLFRSNAYQQADYVGRKTAEGERKAGKALATGGTAGVIGGAMAGGIRVMGPSAAVGLAGAGLHAHAKNRKTKARRKAYDAIPDSQKLGKPGQKAADLDRRNWVGEQNGFKGTKTRYEREAIARFGKRERDRSDDATKLGLGAAAGGLGASVAGASRMEHLLYNPKDDWAKHRRAAKRARKMGTHGRGAILGGLGVAGAASLEERLNKRKDEPFRNWFNNPDNAYKDWRSLGQIEQIKLIENYNTGGHLNEIGMPKSSKKKVSKAWDESKVKRDKGKFTQKSGVNEVPGSKGMDPERRKQIIANSVAGLGVAGSVADAAALKAGWAESKAAQKSPVGVGRPGPMKSARGAAARHNVSRLAGRAKYAAGKGSFPLQVVGLGAGLGGSYFARQAGKKDDVTKRSPMSYDDLIEFGKASQQNADRHREGRNKLVAAGLGTVAAGEAGARAALRGAKKADARSELATRVANSSPNAPWLDGPKRAKAGAMAQQSGMKAMALRSAASSAKVNGRVYGGAMLVGAGLAGNKARKERDAMSKRNKENTPRYDKKTGQRVRNRYNPKQRTSQENASNSLAANAGAAAGALGLGAAAWSKNPKIAAAIGRGTTKLRQRNNISRETAGLGYQTARSVARDPRIATGAGAVAGAVAGGTASEKGHLAYLNRGTTTRKPKRDQGGRFSKALDVDELFRKAQEQPTRVVVVRQKKQKKPGQLASNLGAGAVAAGAGDAMMNAMDRHTLKTSPPGSTAAASAKRSLETGRVLSRYTGTPKQMGIAGGALMGVGLAQAHHARKKQRQNSPVVSKARQQRDHWEGAKKGSKIGAGLNAAIGGAGGAGLGAFMGSQGLGPGGKKGGKAALAGAAAMGVPAAIGGGIQGGAAGAGIGALIGSKKKKPVAKRDKRNERLSAGVGAAGAGVAGVGAAGYQSNVKRAESFLSQAEASTKLAEDRINQARKTPAGNPRAMKYAEHAQMNNDHAKKLAGKAGKAVNAASNFRTAHKAGVATALGGGAAYAYNRHKRVEKALDTETLFDIARYGDVEKKFQEETVAGGLAGAGLGLATRKGMLIPGAAGALVGAGVGHARKANQPKKKPVKKALDTDDLFAKAREFDIEKFERETKKGAKVGAAINGAAGALVGGAVGAKHLGSKAAVPMAIQGGISGAAQGALLGSGVGAIQASRRKKRQGVQKVLSPDELFEKARERKQYEASTGATIGGAVGAGVGSTLAGHGLRHAGVKHAKGNAMMNPSKFMQGRRMIRAGNALKSPKGSGLAAGAGALAGTAATFREKRTEGEGGGD